MKNDQKIWTLLTASTLAAVSCGLLQMQASADTLKGSIDQTDIQPSTVKTPKPVLEMPTPVLPANTEKDQLKSGTGQMDQNNNLKGSTDDNVLYGTAEDEGDIEFKRRFGSYDPTKNVLKVGANKNILQGNAQTGGGNLVSQDPDFGDKELAVAWDKWRNRFLWSVQSGVTQSLNDPNNPQIRWDPQSQTMVSKFPMGTVAWFSCTVTKDREIKSLKLTHSSGFPEYDQAVLNSVRALEGSAILKFPRRSRRLSVNQNAGVRTATTSRRQFFKFNDVERYRYRP